MALRYNTLPENGEVRGQISTIVSRTSFAVNRGKDNGVERDMKALVLMKELEVNDPENGRVLGMIKDIPLGQGKVSSLSDSWCIISVQLAEGRQAIQVGDMVILGGELTKRFRL